MTTKPKALRAKDGKFLPGTPSIGDPQGAAYSPDSKAESKQLFLDAFEKDYHPGNAAKSAGVSKDTIRNWAREDPEFGKAIAEIKSWHMDNLEESLYKRALNAKVDPKAANTASIMLLNANRRKKFSPKNGNAEHGNVVFQLIIGAKPELAKPEPDVTIEAEDVKAIEAEVTESIDAALKDDLVDA